MNSDKFRDMVFLVSQSLRPEESHDIAYLYELPERFHHTRPIDVLMQLEIEQKIHKGNPETLVTVLERVKRVDLANKVKRMIKKCHKKHHNKLPSGKPTDHFHMLHFELALAKMQMEHTSHRINILQEHLQHWTSFNFSSEFKTALDHCHQANTCLSTIEKKIRTTSSKISGKEDEFLSDSSCSSSMEDISLYYHDEIEKESTATAQTPEVRIRKGSIPLIGLTKETLIKTEDKKTNDRLSLHSNSADDSGFVDVRPFLKEPFDKEDEGIYEEIRLTKDNKLQRLQTKAPLQSDDINYMQINQSQVIFNEYMTMRRATYHTTASNMANCLDKGHSTSESHKIKDTCSL